jgi:riboflavin kinase/FMN adenylyltransferase
MEWIEDAWGAKDLPSPAAATIGNYDGVHRGQQAILAVLVERARELGLSAAVITFEPHPLTVVAPERAPRRLASRAQKRDLLAAAGIDAVLEIRFSAEFSETRAEEFVRRFLVGRLDAREVVVGRQFGFGRRQEGDLALLGELGAKLGFLARGVPEVSYLESPISSSRIRAAVAAGDLEAAGDMLGRPFALRGRIVHGERRGRGLGWPTINLMPEQEVIPARGVYVTEVQLIGESGLRPAVTNVGVRPTVSEGRDLVVESHILDFGRDVYGMEAEVAFIKRLRDEQAFESVEALSRQIQHDVGRARQFFAERA